MAERNAGFNSRTVESAKKLINAKCCKALWKNREAQTPKWANVSHWHPFSHGLSLHLLVRSMVLYRIHAQTNTLTRWIFEIHAVEEYEINSINLNMSIFALCQKELCDINLRTLHHWPSAPVVWSGCTKNYNFVTFTQWRFRTKVVWKCRFWTTFFSPGKTEFCPVRDRLPPLQIL
jgi:hypothetical protein